MRRHGGGEARPETGREVADLEPWGGEPGYGRRSAWEVSRVPEGMGRQVFRIPDFQKADIENCSGDDRFVPKADSQKILLSDG